MCVVRQPRLLFFVGLALEQQRAVFEVPESINRVVYAAWEKLGGESVAGIVLSAGRVDARSEWLLDEARREKLRHVAVHQSEVAASVAALYRLEKPFDGEEFVEWFERVRSAQADVLERSLLPMFT